EAILHVTLQDAVLDQHRALRRVAFVVDVERSAAPLERALVDDGDALPRPALAHAPGKGAGPFAVEVALQSVADRFVQQDARPAAAENDRHVAGRSRAPRQIQHPRVYRLSGV